MFLNNYELSGIERLTAIKYLSRMNELTWIVTRNLSKNDKFLKNRIKICLFCYSFIFFYKIKTKLSND